MEQNVLQSIPSRPMIFFCVSGMVVSLASSQASVSGLNRWSERVPRPLFVRVLITRYFWPPRAKVKVMAPLFVPSRTPAADVFFSGLLIKAVGNRVHKEAALSHAILAVDHRHVYGVEVKGGFRIATVVLYFDGKRREGAGMLSGVAAIVGLLDDGRRPVP